MTATLEQSIIDALVTDLNSSASLPAHSTVKYRRPRAIMPEDCPLMVVWLLGKAPTPKTTEWFDSQISIGVSWHEETVADAETLMTNEEVAVTLMNARSKIEARVRALAKVGLSDAWEVVPGISQFLPPEMQQGLTEGYALEVITRVTEGS